MPRSTPKNGAELAARVTRLRRSARLERLRARAPRYAFIAGCTILALLGARQIIFPHDHPPPARSHPESDLPLHAFATGFARAYLAYDAADPAARERALRSYLPDHLAPDAGFAPARGAQAVLWAEVASDQEAIAGGRIVTVAAQTDAAPAPVYLAVPLARARGGALTLIGYPAFVGPPLSTTATEERSHPPVTDPELADTARRVVANYLARSPVNLEADVSPDASVTFPTEPLAVTSSDEVVWAIAPGGRAVLISVEATDPRGNQHSLVYELGVANRQGRWYVTWIEVVPNAP